MSYSTEVQSKPVLEAVTDLLIDMTSDWDLELTGGITPSSRLVADLGFESLDVVILIVELEQRFDRNDLPFSELLLAGDVLVEDVSVEELTIFLSRHVTAGREAS